MSEEWNDLSEKAPNRGLNVGVSWQSADLKGILASYLPLKLNSLLSVYA
ncbi:hypothetical protein [Enterovibrio sp. 27052020O]